MKKRIIIGLIVVIIGFIIICLVDKKITSVYLEDFSVDEDVMTINVGVTDSSGYIRKMKMTSGSTNYYYTFYKTFGINSKIGAKDTFKIQLDNNVDEIYFYTGNKGYKLVIKKIEDGTWVKVE